MPPLPLPVLSISAYQVVSAVLPEGPLGAAILLAAWLAASAAVVFVFKRVLVARAQKSHNKFDDILADAMQVPLYLWLALAGLWMVATSFALLPAGWIPALRVLIAALLTFTAAYTLVRVAHGVMALQAARRPAFRTVQGTLEFAVRLVVYVVALMLLLGYLGVEITPILGALGIGALAVALALQDTLANFFAGMYLSLDRPLREGDFVELDGGSLGTIRGYVDDVSWRSVRVRELSNNIYVLPNSRVASGVIKNFDLPVPEQSTLVEASVAYGSPLEHVERVTVEVARDTLRKVDGGVAGFQPFIRFHTFGADGIGFTVILRVRTFVDQYLVKHEFIKALHARYDQEGIVIPFPQRTLHFADGNGAGKSGLHPQGERPARSV